MQFVIQIDINKFNKLNYVHRNKVLQMSNGIEYPGVMRWDLVACLICAWILVYFAIWKSIKSSGKVRYFTATLPFILIIIFLGRAVTLDGAQYGLRFEFKIKNKNTEIQLNIFQFVDTFFVQIGHFLVMQIFG